GKNGRVAVPVGAMARIWRTVRTDPRSAELARSGDVSGDRPRESGVFSRGTLQDGPGPQAIGWRASRAARTTRCRALHRQAASSDGLEILTAMSRREPII